MLAAGPICAAEAPLADASGEQELCGDPNNQAFVKRDPDINAAQPDGMTALIWACWHDDLGTVQQLIAGLAPDVKAANHYGVTPLSTACTNGNQAIVELLLDSGASANSTLPGGETALMSASRTGRLGAVKVLLEKGADVHSRERKGQTALMWAAAEGHVDVVDALLKAGADFQTSLPSGFTSLFFAVREGRSEVVFRLLQGGAKINEPMRPERKNGGAAPGKTFNPLTLAIENGHLRVGSGTFEGGGESE